MKHVRLYSQKGCRNIHLASLKARLEQKQVCIKTLLTSWERKRVQWNKSIKIIKSIFSIASLSLASSSVVSSLQFGHLSNYRSSQPLHLQCLPACCRQRSESKLCWKPFFFFFTPILMVITLSMRKKIKCFCLEKKYPDIF